MGSILSMQWPMHQGGQRRQAPDAVLIMAGILHQWRGRVSVIRGKLTHNDIMRAQGHRQQLVGMLQRFWRRDRQSVEAWVDALLRRGANTSTTAARPAWRPKSARKILHQES